MKLKNRINLGFHMISGQVMNDCVLKLCESISLGIRLLAWDYKTSCLYSFSPKLKLTSNRIVNFHK